MLFVENPRVDPRVFLFLSLSCVPHGFRLLKLNFLIAYLLRIHVFPLIRLFLSLPLSLLLSSHLPLLRVFDARHPAVRLLHPANLPNAAVTLLFCSASWCDCPCLSRTLAQDHRKPDATLNSTESDLIKGRLGTWITRSCC